MASKQLGIGSCVGFLLGCAAGAWGLSVATPPSVPAAETLLVSMPPPEAEPQAVAPRAEGDCSTAEKVSKQRERKRRGVYTKIDPDARTVPIPPGGSGLRSGVRPPGVGCQGDIPSTWSRQEFNGREYYIIPLAGAEGAAQTSNSQAMYSNRDYFLPAVSR
jgi:hypothetical protein